MADESDGQWVTINGNHVLIDGDGKITKGPKHLVGQTISKKGLLSDTAKSATAKQSAKYVGADIQRYSEEKAEPELAKKLSTKGNHAVSLRDNEPVDVIVHKDGKIQHGVELKTMTDNGNNKITMKAAAMEKKAAWMKANKAPMHTVVYDDHNVYEANGVGQHGDIADRKIYYKRGYGSFRVGSMQPVANHTELQKLMNSSEKDLPEAARPTATYVAHRKAARIAA